MLQVVWLGAALQQIIEPESDVKWLMIRQGQEQQRAGAGYGDYICCACLYLYTCSQMSFIPPKHLTCSFFFYFLIDVTGSQGWPTGRTANWDVYSKSGEVGGQRKDKTASRLYLITRERSAELESVCWRAAAPKRKKTNWERQLGGC